MTYSALIYSHSVTPRLRYIVDFLSRYYGLSIKLTPDESSYLKSGLACRINYSYHRITSDEIWIHPHALLSESAVHPVKVECFQQRDRKNNRTYKAFFKTEGDTAFDLFAAIFYLISRYEEYLPAKKDIYGRYAHQNSLAFRENFLHLPLINIWLEDFRILLAEKNDEFIAPLSPFSFLPTYDIDMAWSYRNKGFSRNAGALLKLFLMGRWRSLSKRLSILRRKKPDPFDAYEWMDVLHQLKKLNPVYFFLVAHQKSKYDKNIDVENREFKELIRTTSLKYKVGLHPSWASGDVPSLLPKENKWLEQVVQHPVDASRQHYIRFDLPNTYRNLIAADITHDYSMGYGTINGFRASITSPFYWYDLKNEEASQLLIHPFCFMDANSYYEQEQGPEEALHEMLQYYQTIQSVNGEMITIWHNSFLGTDEEFKGWREVYEQFVTVVTNQSI